MSYEICKTVKVRPAPEDAGKWCVEVVGHSNNVWPRTDSRYICTPRYGTKREADAAMIESAFGGMLQGSNRYSRYMAELCHDIAKSCTFDRLAMLYRLQGRLNSVYYAYSPKYTKREGVEKDEAKAERARADAARCQKRMDALYLALADELAAWKPSKRHFRIWFNPTTSDGIKYYVTGCKEYGFRYCSTSGRTDRAKVFTHIAAARFMRDYASRNPHMEEVEA